MHVDRTVRETTEASADRDGEGAKRYYLQPWRSILLGVILLGFVAPLPLYISLTSDDTVGEGLHAWLAGFFTFSGLLVNAVFLVPAIVGLLFLVKARRIVRAVVDARGLHVLQLDPGMYRSAFQVMNPYPGLTLVPWREISKVGLAGSVWTGELIVVTLRDGRRLKLRTLAMSAHSKRDLVEAAERRLAVSADAAAAGRA